MTSYSYSYSNIGKFKTIILKDSNGEYIEIALRGATLLNYFIKNKSTFQNIVDGFQTEEEIENSKGARNWIMIPFSNRIENGFYSFEGKEYQIKPTYPRTIVIHGFTSIIDFEIESIEIQKDFIEVIFFTDALRKNKFEGYPFDINVFISYRFSMNKLEINVRGINIGDSPAPFGTGWHPYFKTCDEGIDQLILHVDAESCIVTDENLIPQKGTGAYKKIAEGSENDYSAKLNKVIGKKIFDICYNELKVSDNGLIINSIIDKNNEIKISVFQKGGMTLVFSGDTLAQRARKSIAIEPVQFMTNAFNRDEIKNDIKLEPGETRDFYFGLEVEKL